MQPAAVPIPSGPHPDRTAVIYHPAKHSDLAAFRAAVCEVLAEHGLEEPLWVETTPDEPGRRLVEQAVREGVGLVLASGGDGTVTACVAALAGTGIPLGVLPAGTGNLLARNLGLPLGLRDALEVALAGADQWLDVGVANGLPFAVMAGIGFDAEMLAGASEPMKKRVGWPAYIPAALRHIGERPVRAVLRADGGGPQRCAVSGIIVGNVGSLQGHVELLPGARPDDGLLDVVLLSARGAGGWLLLAADLLRGRYSGRRHNLRCRELAVELDRERLWETDGEVAGRTRELRVTVQPGSLLVRVPAAVPS